jgi:hypothetical protein
MGASNSREANNSSAASNGIDTTKSRDAGSSQSSSVFKILNVPK